MTEGAFDARTTLVFAYAALQFADEITAYARDNNYTVEQALRFVDAITADAKHQLLGGP